MGVLEEEGSVSLLNKLSLLTGTTVPGLCLLFSIIAAYPIAIFHRRNLYGKPPGLQHLFFTAVGLTIGFLNFGYDILHTTVTLLVVYVILKTIGGTLHSVIITLAFTMGYLVVGYIKTETDSYDIIWTMPHCILVLRLSGLAFDIYDGSFPEASLSKESKKVALREVPSLLEMAAFAYFPTSFLIGPQFPMKRYQDYVSGKLKHTGESGLPDCVPAAIKTLLTGMVFMGIHFLAGTFFYTDFLTGPQFLERSLFSRILYLGAWSHITLQKYIGIWLLCEGSCTLIGLTYNGSDDKGHAKWDGCANVNVGLFEGAQRFIDYIDSFNINTNNWVLQYVYKRLKFLGNKYLSQVGVLLFLAIWHGLHTGYYVCFAMEFMVVAVEKDFQGVLERNKVFLEFLSKPMIREIKWLVLKFYTIVFMGPCLAPLVLLSSDNWWPLYKNTFFYAQIFWGSWFLLKPLVKSALPPQKTRQE